MEGPQKKQMSHNKCEVKAKVLLLHDFLLPALLGILSSLDSMDLIEVLGECGTYDDGNESKRWSQTTRHCH